MYPKKPKYTVFSDSCGHDYNSSRKGSEQCCSACGVLNFCQGFWNPFESKGFGEFWLLVEREWAEQFKFNSAYLGDFGPPCDCGSSVCDECNPGWELESEGGEEDGYYDF